MDARAFAPPVGCAGGGKEGGRGRGRSGSPFAGRVGVDYHMCMTHEALVAAGCEVTPDAHRRLARWVELLLDENTRTNLTAIRTAESAWRLHVVDSLRVLPRIGECGAARLIDVGSGGGAPGVPLACVCEGLEVCLLEATGKKAAALARMAAALALPRVRVVQGRAEVESRKPPLAGQFDAVTARAVAALPTLIDWIGGFLRCGGRAWLFKTRAALAEVGAAEGAARRAGLRHVANHEYLLPGEATPRVIVEYERAGPNQGFQRASMNG